MLLLQLNRQRDGLVDRQLPRLRRFHRYPTLLAFRSNLKCSPSSSDPSGRCGLYSRSTLANFRLTDSAYGWSSAPRVADGGDRHVVQPDDEVFLLPLARLAVGDRRVLDVQSGRARLEELGGGLVDAVHDREILECRLAGASAAPVAVDPEFATPQENESTSISSLCLASTDSPLMSPIFAKMSVAIAAPPPAAIGTILETAGGPNRAIEAIEHYSAIRPKGR